MRTLKIIVAESDPLLQKLYADLIESEPVFTLIKCVSTGPQMFEVMNCLDVDLVLLDLYLKEFNALEGLYKLRTQFPKTDYIAASSGDDPGVVRKALCQGVFEYLIKPFPFERLKSALHNYEVYHRGLTGRTRPWRQEDLDSLILMKHHGPAQAAGRAIPKGLQAKCLNDVEKFLKDNPGAFSAHEVGDRLGISRSTARRYLEFLAMNERVAVEYAYRRVGRPEKRYRLTPA